MEELEKYYQITLMTDSVMTASHSTVVLVPFSISEAIYNAIVYLIKNIMVTFKFTRTYAPETEAAFKLKIPQNL